MAAIRFDRVQKEFSGAATPALSDLSLEVADSEFLVLVGPSGCGKSTALRLAAGLEELTGGRILVGGEAIEDYAPWERNLAMVFQSYALYPHLSVADNIGFPLKVDGFDRATRRSRVAEVAEVLDIADLLGRKPAEISGGQRQRVAIGRALVRQPDAFLMDEPLSNLDAQFRVEMRTELLRIHRDVKTTTVYVTHDQVEAMTMGDRIAVLRDGVLQQVGTPAEVYGSPRNLFTGTFIGSPPMNIFRGSVTAGPGGLVLTSGAFSLPLERDDIPEGPVIAGARPERLGIADSAANARGIPARVEFVEILGFDAHLALQTELEQMSAVNGSVRLTHGRGPGGHLMIRCPADLGVAPGASLRVTVEPAHLHLFDASTGERL